MKIAVVGTGYVGLVTGTCLAETGNSVVCVDNNPRKLEMLEAGEIPIYEPGLEVLFERNIRQGRLKFTSDLAGASKAADIIFLALPTPPGEDGSADLSYVLGVSEQLGQIIEKYTIIIDKSTVPVGTAEKVHAAIAQNARCEFDVVSNPEFLKEGMAVEDFLKPDRIVIGTESERAREILRRLYGPYVRQGNPIIFMDERSAEMTKYAANSYLATRITFMNEVANLCEKLGADAEMVRRGMGSDKRIGNRFLFPGAGYGGSCFPKDVQALSRTADKVGYDFQVLKSVMQVNDIQRHILAEKVKKYFGESIAGRKIAVWGLAFKPNTDDIREAPAGYIMEDLAEAGAKISAFDPEAVPNMREKYGEKFDWAEDQYQALEVADALLIVTEWSVFRNPDFERMESLMKSKIIFDGRNLFEPGDLAKSGWYYNSIGRPLADTK